MLRMARAPMPKSDKLRRMRMLKRTVRSVLQAIELVDRATLTRYKMMEDLAIGSGNKFYLGTVLAKAKQIMLTADDFLSSLSLRVGKSFDEFKDRLSSCSALPNDKPVQNNNNSYAVCRASWEVHISTLSGSAGSD